VHPAVAADHAGLSLKERGREYLGALGHTVEDPDTRSTARPTIETLPNQLQRRFWRDELSAAY
jgi:hypothetical protein